MTNTNHIRVSAAEGHDAVLDRAGHDQPVDGDRSHLPDAVRAVGCLVFDSGVGSAILDLGGVEVEAALIEACDSGLVDASMFDAEYVRAHLQAGERRVDVRLQTTEDEHQWISRWACFQ